MIKKVRKAVIPAAGLGTRFLPATKSMPKEMLPIVDTPNIQYIVEEAVKAGIESILIIISGTKNAIENHFDYNFELEERLRKAGKDKQADMVHSIGDMADVFYVRQKNPRGLGHAILCAKDFIGDEPFAVLLGDDLVVPDDDGKPAIGALIETYYKHGTSVLGCKKVPHESISKYGSVKPAFELKGDESEFPVADMIEKPQPEEAFTDVAILGRYVCTPDIFDFLMKTKPGRNNEIQLTDAFQAQCKALGEIYACNYPGTRYDIGDKMGFIKANVEMAMRRPDLGEDVKEYIKELSKKL